MVTDTIERVRAYVRLPGKTKKGLAELARIHPNTLQGIEREDWNPSASTLKALEPHITQEV